MSNRSETYTLLQQRVEQDLAPLLQRGFRILESECSDEPTGALITLGRERAWVSLSFDIRDRVGSLYVGKLSGQRPAWPHWDILNYLVRLCGFRGRISYELSVEERREMPIGQIMASDFKVLVGALLQLAPRIVDDTEDFAQAAPG
jgi:hypothetical protein